MTLFHTQKQLNKASTFFSSTYSFSATVSYISSFFCILYLPLLFLCSVLHPFLQGLMPPTVLISLFKLLKSPLFLLCSISPLLFCASFYTHGHSLHHSLVLFLYSAPHLLVHLHSILLHCLHQDSCHCSRQVCISHTICFPVLSFYLAPAVNINNPSSPHYLFLWLQADVSSSLLAALPGSEPLVRREMEELDQSRHTSS